MAFIVIATLLLAPALVSAGYSDEITDPEGDVSYVTETGYEDDNVERPNIDIVRVSIEESGGEIHVELEVKGTIQEDTYVGYHINLRDENDDSYDLYSGWYAEFIGAVVIEYPTGGETLEASGFGTSTLQTSFSLDLVGNPSSLRINSVETHEVIYEDESGEYYYDTAGPEADEPVNGDTNGNDETNGDFDFDEGIIDDLIARGMLCIALAIILPIIIVIILIVVVLKVLSKDDKGGEQPPQQQYQQPPPPSGPSQTQEQTQSGQGGTPPPPEDMNEE